MYPWTRGKKTKSNLVLNDRIESIQTCSLLDACVPNSLWLLNSPNNLQVLAYDRERRYSSSLLVHKIKLQSDQNLQLNITYKLKLLM